MPGQVAGSEGPMNMILGLSYNKNYSYVHLAWGFEGVSCAVVFLWSERRKKRFVLCALIPLWVHIPLSCACNDCGENQKVDKPSWLNAHASLPLISFSGLTSMPSNMHLFF